jgi:glycosyltransferase involved in cell wall biosynthesis
MLVDASAAPPAPLKIGTLALHVRTFGVADGYGNSAEQIALALERRGVTVALSGPSAPAGFSNAEHIRTRVFERNAFSTVGDAVLWYTPPSSWETQRRTRPAFGYTMYESTRIPAEWIDRMRAVDEVWVPCHKNGELFAEMTSKPVHLIPLGVNAADFAYAKRERGEKLRFLVCLTFSNDGRKNAAGAIRAFKDAFPKRDDVELVLCTSYGALDKDDPRIVLATGKKTTAKLADLYRSCDALIYPSFGEGFGLVPLEAMATGMPAVFTDAMGMHDYADLGLPVKGRAIPARTGHGQAPFGDWVEPLHDLLVDRLREVDKSYGRVMAQAKKDAEKIARVWTWDRTAELIQARLEA